MLKSRSGLKGITRWAVSRRRGSGGSGSSIVSPGSNGDVKQELEHVLSLSNLISRDSAESPDIVQPSEGSDRKVSKSGEDKLSQFHPASGNGPMYTKEVDQLLVGGKKRNPADLRSDNAQSRFRKSAAGALRSEFRINAAKVGFEPIQSDGTDSDALPPRLCHELERVLFQPMNFHTLQDSRSGTFNFSSWLEDIIRVDDFDFEAVSEFITASKDQNMLKLAEQHDKCYYSSTSSMTGILSHMHFLLSNFRKTNMSMISKHFSEQSAQFSWGAQLPAVVIMKRMNNINNNNGVFSIDSDKSSDREIILSLLGHALETVLTTEEEQFKKTFDKTTKTYKASGVKPAGTYHYSKIEDFVLRSQLDAYHPKLPGTGVFDLKTRAVAAVRHDIAYVEENDNYTGYQIQQTLGQFESFERELFELIRSTMLKYSLQARIGRMDGIFVAYHNISKMFGFQYMPLEEMDHILHSYACPNFKKVLEERNNSLKAIFGEETFIVKHDYACFDRDITSKIADTEFKISMSLLNKILKLVESVLPPQFHSCRLVFKAERKKFVDKDGVAHRRPVLNVLIAPLTKGQTDQFQQADLRKEYLQDGEKINEYLQKTRQLNKETTKNLMGFQISVDHEAHHHPNTLVNPRIASKKSNVLDDKAKEFVKDITRRDFYKDSAAWKHIQFFHPLDVLKWTPKFTVQQITNQDKVNKLYMTYLDDKLSALKGQTVSKKSTKSTQEVISERIRKFMTGDELDSNDNKGLDDETDVSQLQAVLRAYSKKGELMNRRQK
ncbi:LANO_0H18910g1_1 [Lachancea nothofagi CBS 11611]|uniref:LANO_0H18910g1_1 n=1 Tax=Lachancea nothofagi CBS 11611 TaxID=1266666 RepID=A0A1G4KNG5_9SACH|nr:LANO_0H18910g1_1 [Lachancea nothofagi CBS 11611]